MQRGKVENATAEMQRGLDQLMERKEGGDEIQSVALSLLETESPIRIAKYSDCFVDDDVRTSIKSQDEISLRRGYYDNCALSSYACSDSLLLTPLCCDDIYDVTPRVSALAECNRLVSEPLGIEK
ncbi:hypothetical protein Tco_0928223 [Tanacetum coccineum]